MYQKNQHPIVACFDGLLDIRDTIWRYLKENRMTPVGILRTIARSIQ
jgi:hypothetical protein